MNNENLSNSNKFKFALSYIPLVAVVLFFAEDKKSKQLMKHIKYWVGLLIIYLLIRFVIVTVLSLWNLWALLTTIYLWISIYLWYKAYKWEDVNIEYLDKIEEKVKANFDTSVIDDIATKVKTKVEQKKEEK